MHRHAAMRTYLIRGFTRAATSTVFLGCPAGTGRASVSNSEEYDQRWANLSECE
jgi:hypothetical protein